MPMNSELFDLISRAIEDQSDEGDLVRQIIELLPWSLRQNSDIAEDVAALLLVQAELYLECARSERRNTQRWRRGGAPC
jgi:hypothetical protein